MEINVLVCGVLLSVFVCVLANEQCNDRNCYASNGSVCNDKGTCSCGACKCDGYYAGPTCEECPTCVDSCEIFKDCVACKIFMSDVMSFMECIDRCDKIANFYPMDKSEFDTSSDDGLKLCNYLNERTCMESFKIGGMTDGYRDLYVRTEVNCDVTTTTTLSVIDVGAVNDKDDQHGGGYNNEKEDAAVASGSGEIKSNPGNSAVTMTSELSVLMVPFLCLTYNLLSR